MTLDRAAGVGDAIDVAIVGAGPAGSRAAYLLARSGARVTIFDPSHPREKACGGGVTGRALALVRETIDSRALAKTVVRSARFTSICGRQAASRSARGVDSARVELDPDALVVASRAVFDAALLDAAVRAGAELRRARVTDVSVDARGARLDTTSGSHRAAFVIGADGANSLVRRRVCGAFARNQLSIATGYRARGVTSEEIVVEFVADPPGYIWSFPRPDHLAIGICAQADGGAQIGDLRVRVARWITDARVADGAQLDAYSWPIPSLGARDFDVLQAASGNWALVGDAAGLVDPITREGIYFAIKSADWIAEALSGRDPARNYAAHVRDEAACELARAARLKAGFFRPSFVGVMLRAIEESAAIRAIMADLIAGRQPYATLKWRLIKTLEVGVAWRALTA